MKKLSLVVVLLGAVGLWSGCVPADCESCEDWEECVDGTCELSDGRCSGDTDCDGDTPTCDDNHTCVAGGSCDPACAAWESCVDDSCVLQDGRCAGSADCADEAVNTECDLGSHTCVEPGTGTGCANDADCGGATPHCNEIGDCVGGECSGLVCRDYGNAHCEVDPTEGAGCVCDDGNYFDGTVCAPIPECTDDAISNDLTAPEVVTLPYTGTHTMCTDTMDAFSFEGQAGDLVVAVLDGFDFAVYDLDIYLLNAPELVDTAVVASSAGYEHEVFNVTLEATQTYYLVVSPYGVAATEYNLVIRNNCEGDDECGDLTCIEGACVDFCEADEDCAGPFRACDVPNNLCMDVPCEDDGLPSTAAEATDVAALPIVADYTICADDEDWFKFTMAVGDQLLARMTFTHADGDLDMALYLGVPTEDSERIAGSSGMSDEESFTFEAEEAGDYYLKIYGYSGARGEYSLSLKDACTEAADCGGVGFCKADGKCEAWPECSHDDDCAALDSIDPEETYFCDVLDSATCALPTEHTCGADAHEPNDSHSAGPTLGTAASTAGTICGQDDDWFTMELTEATNTLSLTLTFGGGDLDLVVMGPTDASRTFGYAAEEQDPATGGEEVVEMGYAPAGTYWVTVMRYLGMDEADDEDVDYALEVSAVTTDACAGPETCADTMPLRSVCEAGACINMDADGTVALGGFCEDADNCVAAPGEDTEPLCMEFGPGTPSYDNFCSAYCETDADCNALGISDWCAVVADYGFFQILACLQNCEGDAYCIDVMGEGATCVEGKCQGAAG